MPRNTKIIFRGWRVEDDYSRAFYREGEGISAESDRWVPLNPRNLYEQKKLLSEVKSHLDWQNDSPTPFISVYTDYDHARAEAERRARERSNVVIYELVISAQDVEEYGPIHFRKVTKLMEETLQSRIPGYVGGNAEDEFLFLHHIPEEVIEGEEHFE